MSKANNNFEDLIRRVGIDAEPRPAHKAKLRWQMLSAFNKTALRQESRQMKRRKIMINPITKLTTAAVLIIAAIIALQYFKPAEAIDESGGLPSPIAAAQSARQDSIPSRLIPESLRGGRRPTRQSPTARAVEIASSLRSSQ